MYSKPFSLQDDKMHVSNRNYDLQKIINHIHFVILEREPPPPNF